MFSLIVALALYLAAAPAQAADAFSAYRAFLPAAAVAKVVIEQPLALPVSAPLKKDPRRLGVEINAASAAVLDWDSDAWLFEKDPDAARPIASLTKLVTVLTALDQDLDWDERLEIGAADIRAARGEYLFSGETATVRDLFNLSLIASSNEAAAALARSTGLTEPEFVAQMNLKAQELGLASGRFVEPTGLDPDNRASARDVARLVKASVAVPIIAETVVKKEYVYEPREGVRRRARSTDLLLDSFISKPPFSLLGGKTGYLQEAGYCFGAAAADGSGHRVIAVVLGADTKDERFSSVKKLIYWVFDAFTWSDQAVR
ncbi:MAG: serine hydrolase [Patescibacteria group bacterium]|jgi:D-alanyl-D-alanine endopeptidase (penicillin-binding protein 7)